VAESKQSRGKKFCYQFPRPAVTVDIVLFHRLQRLEVLLIKRRKEPFKDRWAFPGGFVDENESLENAAARELQEETGLKGIKLEQIGAFGDTGSDPRGHTVSVVFAAVLEKRQEARAADDASDAQWHSARRPPKLAFDHQKILKIAIERVEDWLS